MLIDLVDSNVEYRGALARVLGEVGEVRESGDVLTAIAGMAERVPDVVVVAVALVGPNAFALVHEMRSYEDLGRVPVILLADDEMGDVAAYGAVVLDKRTLRPEELLAAVQRLCKSEVG
jgi:DNA-binding response OmpR family regulator